MGKLSGFFEDYMNKKSIFKDKTKLQLYYNPNEIVHRDKEINEVANILAPCLRKETPSNLFLYGKTGTGKTLVASHVLDEMKKIAEKNNILVDFIYINCKLKKVADTEYRVLAQFIKYFGGNVPSTGLPTDEIYKIFYEYLENTNKHYVLVLDEIDQIVKKIGDSFLYNLTRINTELKTSKISLVGISNDTMFIDNLDPRVKSSLSEEEILFSPYNALQMQDILRNRANDAFNKECLKPGVIEKCAAYSAREHGDARRALELLRVAGEIADRKGLEFIDMTHLDEAERKIEKDRLVDIALNQPKQFQVVFYSILLNYEKKDFMYSSEIYELYKKLSLKLNIRPLTQRRVSGIISEFDMMGMIYSRVISHGRYGRTKEVSLSISKNLLEKLKSALEKIL